MSHDHRDQGSPLPLTGPGPSQEETRELEAILRKPEPVIAEEEVDVGEPEPGIAEEDSDPNYVLEERSQQLELSDFSGTDVEESDLYGDAENPYGIEAEDYDYVVNVDWLGAFPRTEEENDANIPSEYEDDDDDDMQTQKGFDCDEASRSKKFSNFNEENCNTRYCIK
ncbi:hypothetical protein CJ030_MR1G022631 [Morella rubra]|uniref:Uncharacterized protein n=1 Tax=Morella rubra TaxID=262757 RepID=A0A6A1WPK8_9ROSI|nr:hypothetical protein CJ030_MR1G022631 [Morella rubra]